MRYSSAVLIILTNLSRLIHKGDRQNFIPQLVRNLQALLIRYYLLQGSDRGKEQTDFFLLGNLSQAVWAQL